MCNHARRRSWLHLDIILSANETSDERPSGFILHTAHGGTDLGARASKASLAEILLTKMCATPKNPFSFNNSIASAMLPFIQECTCPPSTVCLHTAITTFPSQVLAATHCLTLATARTWQPCRSNKQTAVLFPTYIPPECMSQSWHFCSTATLGCPDQSNHCWWYL